MFVIAISILVCASMSYTGFVLWENGFVSWNILVVFTVYCGHSAVSEILGSILECLFGSHSRAFASSHRFCMDGVSWFTFSHSRHSFSGMEGCPLFIHSGSTIWRNSRPQPGPCLPAESLLVVLDMVCGGDSSLLGS